MALPRSGRVVEEKPSACIGGRWRRCWEALRVGDPALEVGAFQTAGPLLSAARPVLCAPLCMGCCHQTRA